MSNEPLGIYEELKARREQFPDHTRRKAFTGPTANGAYAQPYNPFGLQLRLKKRPPFYVRRDTFERRREVHPEAGLNLSIGEVVQVVLTESHTKPGDLLGPARARHLAWPRQIAIWAIDRYCPSYSLPDIGYVFSRDHTTIMHAIEAVDMRLKNQEPSTVALVASIRRHLASLRTV